MAESRDYKIEAVVLKWVKLKESDVIIKFVNQAGCLVEGIAHGARKPKSSASGKLEPLNCAEVFLSRGRGLDVVKDCRVLQRNEALREDPSKFACASCLSELLCKSLQPDVDIPNIFGLTCAYLRELAEVDGSKLMCLTAAALLKAASYLGFMPSTRRCVLCDKSIENHGDAHFSYSEGGLICSDCSSLVERTNIDASTIVNADAFLHMRLSDIASSDADERIGLNVLQFANAWINAQMGIRLKSVPLAINMCV